MSDKVCVFISYKRENQSFAERLWQMLEQWGYDRWLDVKNIQSGISPQSSTWIDAIHKGLKQSQVLVGIVTPESLASQNVKDEWYWARQANRRILLLRLEPFDVEDMPPPFAATDYIDLVNDPEKGFERLQHELAALQQDRADFKREMSLEVATADRPPLLPLELPDYLRAVSHRQYVPWRMTLRFLGGVGIPISFLWLVTQPDFEPLLTFFGSIGAVLASSVGAEAPDGDLQRFSKLSDVQQMRQRVYDNWVKGVMQTALKEVESVGIGLNMQPEAVLRDTRRNVGDIELPNDSRHVRHVYDTFGSFLILGDPGAGKTIMLLQLAESLILNPPPTHQNAIPLVLNLSSWSLSQKPLHEWLEDETWRSYRVRGGRVKQWLSNNQLILLLDGLDEVKEEIRPLCVEAINAFQQAHKNVPMVVCSRIKDYERLGASKLQLSGAILLEDLSAEQVNRYLADPQLAHLKHVVDDDSILRDMATTPFLLNTMIYAYRQLPESALRGYSTEAQRREHLFDTYVQRRLQDNPSPWGYDNTIQYLRWLATKMQAYVQTVFHPSDIQFDWFADAEALPRLISYLRWGYVTILTMLFAIMGLLMGGVIGLLSWGALGLLVSAVLVTFQGFHFRSRDEFSEISKWEYAVLLYVILAPVLGVLLLSGLSAYMPELAAYAVLSIGFGSPVMVLFRDDTDDLRGLGGVLLVTALIGLGIGGLALSLITALALPIALEALVVALVTCAIIGHALLIEGEDYDVNATPATNTGLIFVSSLLAVIGFGAVGYALQGLALGIIMGGAAALTYSGFTNGLALLDKFGLRLYIQRQQLLPLRTMRFLDALTERQILREMGGGYIFIHRYLLENFAGLDEIYVLIDQLQDKNRREKSLETLARLIDDASATTIKTIQNAIAWDNTDVHPLERHYCVDLLRENDIEIPDNRHGVGLIKVGEKAGLPDIDWVHIPAGEFSYQDGTATTDYDYYLSRYLLTYQQYQAFLDAADGFADDRWWAGMPEKAEAYGATYVVREQYEQKYKYGNHPRETVSWYQAMAFCRWLSYKLTGAEPSDDPLTWEVRLPTEREWEKGARGNTGWQYPYGNEYDPQKANTSDTGIGKTSAVGLFPNGASPYGLLDMSGNVWEWCLNKYDEPDVVLIDGTNKQRVLRGGSFGFGGGSTRAVFRKSALPSDWSLSLGLRLFRRPSS